jgi:hypothetical protein
MWHYCRRRNVMMALGRCGRNVRGRDKSSLVITENRSCGCRK